MTTKDRDDAAHSQTYDIRSAIQEGQILEGREIMLAVLWSFYFLMNCHELVR